MPCRRPDRGSRRSARAPTIEHADIVETEETAFEAIVAGPVLAVDPPREIHQQLGEGVLEELDIAFSLMTRLVGQIILYRRIRVHGRIDVTEVPLVGRNLPVRVQVIVAQHEIELLFGEVAIDDHERDRVEGQIPGGEPGILPLVRHRDDVVVEHVGPLGIAHPAPLLDRHRRPGAVFGQPCVQVIVKVLLGPQHAGERLAHHPGAVLIRLHGGGHDRGIELVGLLAPRLEDRIEVAERLGRRLRRRAHQAQADDVRCAGPDADLVVSRRLRSFLRRVHRRRITVNNEIIDAVLHVGRGVRRCEQAGVVGLVLREQERHLAFTVEEVVLQGFLKQRIGVVGVDGGMALGAGLFQHRLRAAPRPRPRVAEPQRGENMQGGRRGAAVADGDLDQHILGRRLRVFHEDIEVAVLIGYAGIEKLIFGFVPTAPAIGLHQIAVGECGLRILIQIFHVRMGRRRVEVEVVLLDILPVVALAVGEPEQTFFQDRILAVPQRRRKTQDLMVVAEAAEPVLAPMIGARARLIVREIVPGVAVVAVVLAHSAPLALAQVGTPLLPWGGLFTRFPKPFLFLAHKVCLPTTNIPRADRRQVAFPLTRLPGDCRPETEVVCMPVTVAGPARRRCPASRPLLHSEA